MTVRFQFQAARQTETKATVVVQESLIGLDVWPDVPMVRKFEEDLTAIDRLLLEAAIALDPVHAAEIEEITGIPAEAVDGIISRLVSLGLLQTDGYGAVATDYARPALDQAAAVRLRQTPVTLLYLADTDEIVALSSAEGRRAPRLHRTEPAGFVDVPRGAGLTSQHNLIAERIAAQAIPGLPQDIVSPVVTETQITDVCKQYRCSGHVRVGSDGTSRAYLKIEVGRSKRLTLQIPYANQLASRWEDLAQQAASAADAWGPVVATRTGGSWLYELGQEAAASAAADRIRLGHPGGLLIHGERDVVYVDVEFVPGDELASRIFALQHAVAEVSARSVANINSAELAAITAASAERYGLPTDGLTVADVRSALWTGQHYQHVYALRREEDFPGE
ncbi:hypothetical protein [Micromonospora sp. NBC_01813]|uniref:hypothetical protein n=1 Tax=Micromonospora sp. NBC_01813 TaxID=2975988 RepID=UPI002DD87B2E|nr:hypothetical protein [Micromonospora sp. NBC_01813]WSA08793.1 hypothetical protein OG958_32290 [Micromonospora sp. NBC_01813]